MELEFKKNILDLVLYNTDVYKEMLENPEMHIYATGFMFVGFGIDDPSDDDFVLGQLMFIMMDNYNIMRPFCINISINKENIDSVLKLAEKYNMEKNQSPQANMIRSAKCDHNITFTDMVHVEGDSSTFPYTILGKISLDKMRPIHIHIEPQTFIALEMFRTQFIMLDFFGKSNEVWVEQMESTLSTFNCRYFNAPSAGPVYTLRTWLNYTLFSHLEEQDKYSMIIKTELLHNGYPFEINMGIYGTLDFARALFNLLDQIGIEEGTEDITKVDAVVCAGGLSKRFDLENMKLVDQVFLGCINISDHNNEEATVIKCELEDNDIPRMIAGFLSNFTV